MAASVLDQIKRLLRDAVEETGVTLKEDVDTVAIFLNERALHLAAIIDEPGFSQAVRAARNRVAMRAGVEISDAADQADNRILGVIQGALALAAGLLA